MSHLFYDDLIKKLPEDDIKTMLRQATVINAGGALLKVLREGVAIEELPALVPPYEYTYIELGGVISQLKTRTGAFIFTTDYKREGSLEAVYGIEPSEEPRWKLHISLYLDTPSVVARTPLAYTTVVLDAQGQPISMWDGESLAYSVIYDNPAYYARFEPIFQEFSEYVKRESFERMGQHILDAALYTIGLTHCKNVILEETGLPRRLEKKRLKHGKPATRYHILKITGKGNSAGESLGTAHAGHNALHWCRGHFRTYTDDAPLFGHITGTFYVSPHVRGRTSEGIVNKDYQVQIEGGK